MVVVTHLPQVAAYADAHLVVGKRVERGRTFTESDAGGTNAPEIAVISSTMAEKYWPGRSPIGGRVRAEGARGLRARLWPPRPENDHVQGSPCAPLAATAGKRTRSGECVTPAQARTAPSRPRALR